MPDSVKHVIVLMLENRSFDHMLGNLQSAYPPNTFEGLSGAESNPDSTGTNIKASDKASAILAKGPDHSHKGVMLQLTGSTPPGSAITNKGFIHSYAKTTKGNGHDVMKCFHPERVPVLAGLALGFTVCDHWFCSVPGETWPNRNYLHAATSDGEVDIVMRPYWRKTVFGTLKDAGHEWAVYHRGPAQVWAFPSVWQSPFSRHKRFRKLDKLTADIRGGNLPAYTFVEPDHGLLKPKHRSNSEHPSNNDSLGRDFYAGERLILDIYAALISTPAVWKDVLFMITYDEHGGFFDHVPPPKATPPDAKKHKDFDFDLLGVRVPTVLISPWAKAMHVDPKKYEHSAVPASLRERFAPGQPHLTKRDAGSDTIWHNLSLPKPREAGEVPDPKKLEELLNAIASADTGVKAGAPVQADEQQPQLDELQRELFQLAIRVDVALKTAPPNAELNPTLVDAAMKGDYPQGMTFINNISAAALSETPELLTAPARAEYIEDVERRFRGE